MKWFRSNIKHGSRLALLALALVIGLSFGHFHGGRRTDLRSNRPLGCGTSMPRQAALSASEPAPAPASAIMIFRPSPGRGLRHLRRRRAGEHGPVRLAAAAGVAAGRLGLPYLTTGAEFVHRARSVPLSNPALLPPPEHDRSMYSRGDRRVTRD